MPKKKKTSAKSGLSRNPVGMPAPVDWEALSKAQPNDDRGSDSGSFRDDEDLGDFLPAQWQRCGDADSGTTVTANTALADSIEIKETTTTVKVDSKLTTPLRISETSTRTTTSRIIVPVAPTPKTRSPLEELRSELAKKDRDLKSAKSQAAAARSELELLKSKQDEAVSRLRQDLQAQHNIHCEDLEEEYKQVEGERDKATLDLRKLRDSHEKHRKEKEGIQKKLFNAKAEAMDLRRLNAALQKKISNHPMIIGLLKNELAEAQESSKRLEATLAAEKSRGDTLRQSITALEASNRDLTTQKLQKDVSSFQEVFDLRKEKGRLSREHRTLKTERDELRSEADDAKEELRRQHRQISSLQHKITWAERDLAAEMSKSASLAREIQGQKEELDSLNSERELHQPIIENSRDIGLRIFEQARETVYNLSRGEVDRAIIESGNAAAHSANGEFLAALINADLVPEDYLENATEIFEELYGTPAESYCHVSKERKRLEDCVATLRTLRPINDGSESIDLRKKHKLRASFTRQYIDENLPPWEWDNVIKECLTQLESLTEQIVEIDRRRHGRRQRNRDRGTAEYPSPDNYGHAHARDEYDVRDDW